mgnify:CR=1 FL=1
MCGITELESLIQILNTKSPILTGTIRSDDLLFMYVKNYCHYSKKACQKVISNNMTNVKIIDVVNRAWTAPSNIAKPTCSRIPPQFRDDIDVRFATRETVPQIFVYRNDKWHYIGGCDSFMEITIVQPPMLRLTNVSSGASRKSTPAVALKW